MHAELLLGGKGKDEHGEGIYTQFPHKLGFKCNVCKICLGTDYGKDFLESVEYFLSCHTRATFMLPVRLKSSVRTVTFLI